MFAQCCSADEFRCSLISTHVYYWPPLGWADLWLEVTTEMPLPSSLSLQRCTTSLESSWGTHTLSLSCSLIILDMWYLFLWNYTCRRTVLASSNTDSSMDPVKSCSNMACRQSSSQQDALYTGMIILWGNKHTCGESKTNSGMLGQPDSHQFSSWWH